MNTLIQLIDVEEKIEKLFKILVELEISNQKNSVLFFNTMQQISVLTKKESSLLIEANDYYGDMRDELEAYHVKKLPINLGFNVNAPILRLHLLLDSICADSGVEYADAIHYDIHRILLKFLEYMIDNPYYEEIREDLLYFKYDIIFLDYNVEHDFLMMKDFTRVSLDSRALKEDLPSAKYIEQAILVWEIEEAVKEIESVNDINAYAHIHSLVVLKIMQIFARMALCNEEQLNYVMDDVRYLMENDEIDIRIKEIMGEMTEIFEQIQTSFYFSR